MTNFEKIKSEMTVEELAIKMADYYELCDNCPVFKCDYNKPCETNIKDWLKSEVDAE